MPFGTLTDEQLLVVQRHVEGQVVHDLGAGDLVLSRTLLLQGAEKVYAVDKTLPRRRPDPGIVLVGGYFHHYPAVPTVAFVSWPTNIQDLGLIKVVERSQKVIYLGCNWGGTMCGSPLLFQHLCQREVLDHVPDRSNTLIVYGPATVKRKPLGEEWAGMNLDRIWSFEDTLKQDRHAPR